MQIDDAEREETHPIREALRAGSARLPSIFERRAAQEGTDGGEMNSKRCCSNKIGSATTQCVVSDLDM